MSAPVRTGLSFADRNDPRIGANRADVDIPISMVNLGIITKRTRTLSPAVMEFIKHLKAP